MTVARAVVIGASAGAVEALTAILPALPGDFPLPVMVVVHVPPDKKSILADLFQYKCKVKVIEAEDKVAIEPASVYFAPPDYHLLVEKNQSLSLSSEEPVLFSRPAIDVLFETAADAYGESLIGIVLSGANEDGAKGLKAIVAAGGTALVQDPATAQSTPMPEAALKACPTALRLSLAEIAAYLQKVEAS